MPKNIVTNTFGEFQYQREYYQQFRDILFLVDKSGLVRYQSLIASNYLLDNSQPIHDISQVFPSFKEVTAVIGSKNDHNTFLLQNEPKKLWGEAVSCKVGNELIFFVVVHNPKATAFIFELLSNGQQELFRDYFKDNIKRFIQFTYQIKNFLALITNYLENSDDDHDVLTQAVKYISDHADFYRGLYLQQNRIINNRREDIISSRGDNAITLDYLLSEFKKFAGSAKVIVANEKDVLNKQIRGERNWLSYAFKNIADLLSTTFPEIDPIKITIQDRPERNQINMKVDFSQLHSENIKYFTKSHIDDQSTFYNTTKIMEMNRSNLFYDEANKELVMTMPLYNKESSVDEIVILIADADRAFRDKVVNSLSSVHYKIRHFEATDPDSAVKGVAELDPDFIVIDPLFYSKNNDVTDILDSIYSVQVDQRPNLLIYSHYDRIESVLPLLYGFYNFDFIRKELSDQELTISISQAVSNARSLKILNTLANNARRASEIDGLTGAFNRQFYDELVKLEIDKAAKNKTTLGIIAADIDHFKEYNDNNGHLAGDQVLREFVAILKENVRASDYVARYGGEEFTVVLINASPQSLAAVAEKIRKSIEDYKFKNEHKQPLGNLTASFGVGCFPIDGDSYEKVFQTADERLYAAKNLGRNKVVAWKTE